ncbi:MAG TPA: DUF748 domain-containing protein [Alcanivorax sp.]|nr:DUF748 domain-containing protein [Alcanivorax sp.]
MDTPIQWWRSRGWGARILAILALLYVLYALTIFLILPGWVRGEVEERLSGLLGRDVTVEEVHLNPLTLSATAEQFRIADSGTEFLARFDRLYVNAGFWASLFHWRPWVSEVDLAGLQVRLRRGKDGALNLDDIITRLRESGKDGKAEETPPDDESSAPPAFTISHLRLSEGRVTLSDASGSEPSSLTLPVAFSIEDLTTRGVGEEDNLYEMHVEGPDGGTLDWQGRFVFEPLTVEGRLQMEKVDVAAFTRLLEPHFPFQVPSGVLGLAADYRYGTGDGEGEGLTVNNGRFQLDRLRILRDGNAEPSFVVPSLKVSGVSLNLAGQRVRVPEVVLTDPKMRAVLTEQGLDLATLFLPSDPEQAQDTREKVREEAEESAERIREGRAWGVTLDQFKIDNGSVVFRDQTLPEPVEVTLSEGALNLTDFRIEDSVRWQWEGSAVLAQSGRLSHSGTGQLTPLKVSADLALTDLPLAALSPWLANAMPLRIEQGRASGDMTLTVAGEAPDITLTGRASVADVKLHENGRLLLSVASLGADGVTVKSADRRIAIDGLAGRGIDFRHLMDEQGRTLVARLAGDDDGEDSGPDWRVILGRVSVEESRLAHRDNTMSPDFEVTLEQWSGVMQDFDTGSGRASLDTSGRVNGQARLRAQGKLDIEPLYLDITGQLDGYGMEALTPFTTRYLGFGVESGRLDVDTEVSIEDGHLDSITKIAADKFYLGDRVESEQALDAPVKLGLSVLRDSSGMIRLPITISGDLSDPGFSTGGVVLRVIRNVLVKAATAPFSMLASLAGGGDADLQYLPFPAGDARPGAGTRDKVARLADILKDRDNLTVVLTGQASEADRRALGEAEVIDDLGGDWPGLDTALTGEDGRERILDTYEDRLDRDRDTLAGSSESDQAREAWRLMLEQAAARVDTDTLRELARERARQARGQLIEEHGLPEDRVRLDDPRVDGDVTGVGLGVGAA